jgi:hypothetical protein
MAKFYCLAVFLLVLSLASSAETKKDIRLIPQGGGYFDVEKKIGSVFSEDSLIPPDMATAAFLSGRAEKRKINEQKPTFFWGFDIDHETVISVWTSDGKTIKKLDTPPKHEFTPNIPGRIVFFLFIAFAGFFGFIYKFCLPKKKHPESMKRLIVFFAWMALACSFYAQFIATNNFRLPFVFVWKDFALIELIAAVIAAVLSLWKKISDSPYFYGFHLAFFWLIFISSYLLFFEFLGEAVVPVTVAGLATCVAYGKCEWTKKKLDDLKKKAI